MIVASSPASLSRTDALSGCCNLLAFADWLVAYCAATPRPSVSLVSLDLKAFVTLDGESNDEDSILLQRIVNDILLRMVALGQMLDESRQLANTDPVTGLPNLRAALEALAAALAQAAAGGSSFALLFIDGDNLRRYNDLGYAAGDAMLQRLCRTLRGRLRPDDLLARWRVGDEFLVLLSNTALERALGLAERLRGAVEEESRAWPYPVTISIGVAVYPRHGETADRLLHAGECAKERAKAEGKNRVVAAAERAGGD